MISSIADPSKYPADSDIAINLFHKMLKTYEIKPKAEKHSTHTTEEEKLVKMFLTLLDFTDRFTVSILRMF